MSFKMKNEIVVIHDPMVLAEQVERCYLRADNPPTPRGKKVTSTTFAKEGWKTAAYAWDVCVNLAIENLELHKQIIDLKLELKKLKK